MKYTWRDYCPETMEYIENWLDDSAVQSTGLDNGFRDFYDYWANEDGFTAGENFWCKVVFQDEEPFAVVAFCLHNSKISIMELVVAPENRGQGRGTMLLKDLILSSELCGRAIQEFEAVIYPDNTASKKAFENAGFQCTHTHRDEDGVSLLYAYENGAENEYKSYGVLI